MGASSALHAPTTMVRTVITAKTVERVVRVTVRAHVVVLEIIDRRRACANVANTPSGLLSRGSASVYTGSA
jgi:hypothetical protein